MVEPSPLPCGVLDVRVEPELISPGESGRGSVMVRFDQTGEFEHQVVIPYRDFEGGVARAELVVTGEGELIATLEPRLSHAGTWIDGAPFPEAHLVYECCPCSAEPGPPVLRFETAKGTLDSSPRFEPRPRYDVLLRSLDPEGLPWGAASVQVLAASADCELHRASARVYVERVPKDLAEEWPATMIVLHGGYPREHRFELPGLEIRSISMQGTDGRFEPRRGIFEAVEVAGESGDVLLVREDPG